MKPSLSFKPGSYFYQFLTHPLWIWYDLFADPAGKDPISETGQRRLDAGKEHESECIAQLQVVTVSTADPDEGVAETIALMKQGVDLIYQGHLRMELDGVLYHGRPDLLEKRPGPSQWGNWHYIPVEIKNSGEAKPEHKYQLALYGHLLEAVQQVLPQELGFINSDQERSSIPFTSVLSQKMWECVQRILAVLKGHKPSHQISSKTKQSRWYTKAFEEALAEQDIALVYDLDPRSIVKLRESGVRTLTDFVKQDLKFLGKIPYCPLKTLEIKQMQARALLENQYFQIAEFKGFPNAPLQLYFDIEGHTDPKFEYLFGFWVVGDPERKWAQTKHVRPSEEGKYFLYFLAKDLETEPLLWAEFLSWLEHLPENYTVYHYADYERQNLLRLAEQYGGSPALDRFLARLVDLAKVVASTLVLPIYSYSIKEVARYPAIGFEWRHEKAGGDQSLLWYEEWRATQNPQTLQTILDYNEDDVRATEKVHLFLEEACSLCQPRA